MEGQAEKRKDIAVSNHGGQTDVLGPISKPQPSEVQNHTTVNNLKIVTYNCKNMETSTYAIEQL